MENSKEDIEKFHKKFFFLFNIAIDGSLPRNDIKDYFLILVIIIYY